MYRTVTGVLASVLLAAFLSSAALCADWTIEPGKGFGWIKVGMDLGYVQKVLGKEESLSAQGGESLYSYEKRFGFSLSAKPGVKGAMEVTAILVLTPSLGNGKTSYRTAKGVAVGSSLEDVRKAYGEPESSDGECLYYTSLGAEFYFTRVTGKVVAVKVKAPAKSAGKPGQGTQPGSGAGAQPQGDLKKLTIEPGRGIMPALTIGMSFEDFKTSTGLKSAEGEQKLDEIRTVYAYNTVGFQLLVQNYQGKNVVAAILLTSPKVAQYEVSDAGGLTVGATRAKVQGAYGKPERQEKKEGNVIWEYYDKKGVAFIFAGDKVDAVFIYQGR